MSEFFLGLILGIIIALGTAPLIAKWYIKKKLNDITGGLLQ